MATAEAVVALAQRAVESPHLRFHGVMVYEAQIAGVTDANPFSQWYHGGQCNRDKAKPVCTIELVNNGKGNKTVPACQILS